jgi:tetratricopeptide (TPR) repeat protein/tRNA A-37 threonylcarbamoyl transferase component Bud32
MSDAERCPKCGRQVPSISPGGLCPKCLLELGLATDAAEAATSPYSPAPSFTPPPAEVLNALFPQIEVESRVGQGGMGAVYRGRQKKLDRQVAIKILPPEIGQDAAFAERFTREARALARLSHPNIVTIHDVGQAGEFYYFVMEYVDGTNLRELIRGREIEPQHALAIVQQICDALAYAHSIGVVHRDIKPENILVDRAGKVKIADFGLAKLVANEAEKLSLTGSEQIMGTLRYMAPEQLEGARDVDHRADIYSLGVVFYELLTGEVPMGRFRPPSEKVQVDVRVDEVVLKSLERERERRYQHASQVRSDVEAIGGSGLAPIASRKELADTLVPAKMTAAMGLVTGVISVGAGLTFLAAVFLSDRGSWQFWVYLLGAVSVGLTGLRQLANSYRQIRMDLTPNAAARSSRELTTPDLLLCALGLVGGLILFCVGVALIPVAFRLAEPGSGAFWAWMGIAIASFFAGVASLLIAWTNYRRFSGQTDWTKTIGWTTFDSALLIYGILGQAIAALCCTIAWSGLLGPTDSPRAKAVIEASLLVGVTMLLQALFGLLFRAPYFLLSSAERQRPTTAARPERDRNVLGWIAKLVVVGFIFAVALITGLSGWVWLSYRPPAAATEAARPLSDEERIERGEALSVEGYALWRQQKLSDAIDKFEQAVALDPQSANAWNGLGWARFNSGQTETAVEAFEKAVKLERNHPAALNGLGQAYFYYGELEKAEPYLLKAAPQAPIAAYGLGKLYLLQGKFDDAAKWLPKAMASDQPNDPLLQQMIAAAKSKELPDELRQRLEPQGKRETGDGPAAAAEGWQRFNEGKLRLAEISFRRALAKQPDNPQALNGLGFCLLASGNWADGKPLFEKCLSLAPNEIGAKNGLARCLKAEGKVDNAIAMWKEIHAKYPGTAATGELATTYLERGEYEKAVPLYEQLVAAMPDNAQLREGLKAAHQGAAQNRGEGQGK